MGFGVVLDFLDEELALYCVREGVDVDACLSCRVVEKVANNFRLSIGRRAREDKCKTDPNFSRRPRAPNITSIAAPIVDFPHSDRPPNATTTFKLCRWTKGLNIISDERPARRFGEN